VTDTLLFPSLLLPNTYVLTMVSFTILVSAVTPGYVLTSEDLELGASDERENAMLVFLGLGYPIQCNLIIQLPEKGTLRAKEQQEVLKTLSYLTSTLTSKFIHPDSASAESVSYLRTSFFGSPVQTEDPEDSVTDVGINFFKLPTWTEDQ
ncbi:hypothetical protein STEG23_007144, partial [Scotinomys teguina]